MDCALSGLAFLSCLSTQGVALGCRIEALRASPGAVAIVTPSPPLSASPIDTSLSGRTLEGEKKQGIEDEGRTDTG